MNGVASSKVKIGQPLHSRERSRSRLKAHRYGQLCQSLLDLQESAEIIFDAISSRVSLEHHRLNVLKSRIQSAQAKVDAISGTKKATTIFSSSRYPFIPPEAQDFTPLYGGKTAGVSWDFPIATISLISGQCQNAVESTVELFQFFSETSHESLPSVHNQKALKGLPSNVKSISDIVLFNSTELPCLKYINVDRLAETDQSSTKEPAKVHTSLPDPPESAFEGGYMARLGSGDFGFRPVLQQVPSFSFPYVLPDLPMVAEINWSADELPSIAPSAIRSGSRKDSSVKAMNDKSAVFEIPQDFSSVTSGSVNSHVLPRSGVANGGADSASMPTTDAKEVSGASNNFEVEQKIQIMQPPPLPPLLPASTLKRELDAGDMKFSLKESRLLHSNLIQRAGVPAHQEEVTAASPAPLISAQSLPPIDAQRAALLASIRNHSLSLRKTGLVDNGKDSSALPSITKPSINGFEHYSTSSRQRQPLNILAEMATTLKMRRLSMQGAAHDKEQFPLRTGEGIGTMEGTGSPSPSSSSGKFTLPIANLHAYIAKRNQDICDDDDDWDDE